MHYKYTGLLILILLINLCSCKKVCDCVESAGTPTEATRVVPYFEQIVANDNINVFISIGTQEQVLIKGGGNLLHDISTEVTNGVLTLKNNNICNWLRSYKNTGIDVYITMPRVTYITNSGFGTIESLDTISTDTFQLSTSNGGSINLNVKSKLVEGHLFGPGDVTLSGTSNQFLCTFVGGTGFLRCNNLITGYTFLSTSTTGDCYVNATNLLIVLIYQIGNVYYIGSPTIQQTITGTGQLIQE